MSRRHTGPIQRAADVIAKAGRDEPATEARAALAAALDDHIIRISAAREAGP